MFFSSDDRGDTDGAEGGGLPPSEQVQVVVVTGRRLAALLSPEDAGGVDDAAVQHRAGHECCKENTSYFTCVLEASSNQT